ncbi:hypothetical protein PanWU01x14_297370, partial [Parasponia andersonii]
GKLRELGSARRSPKGSTTPLQWRIAWRESPIICQTVASPRRCGKPQKMWQAPEDVASWQRLEVKSGIGTLLRDEGELVSIKDHLQVNMQIIDYRQGGKPHQNHDPVCIQLHRVDPRQREKLVEQGRKGES